MVEQADGFQCKGDYVFEFPLSNENTLAQHYHGFPFAARTGGADKFVSQERGPRTHQETGNALSRPL